MYMKMMEVGCIENFIFFSVCLDSMKRLVENYSYCSKLKLCSGIGEVGSLIVATRQRSKIRNQADMRRVFLNVKCWLQIVFFLKNRGIFDVCSILKHKHFKRNNVNFLQWIFPSQSIFFHRCTLIDFTVYILCYLLGFLFFENFQCHIFEQRLKLKIYFSFVTTNCSSLKECLVVFTLNFKFAHEKNSVPSVKNFLQDLNTQKFRNFRSVRTVQLIHQFFWWGQAFFENQLLDPW